jgi:GNAT superfamily N-acetyltransferase
VAEDDDKVVGVAAMQDGRHVLHLFVAKGYERAGLTRKLWLLLKDETLRRGATEAFTIDAPRYAISAYRRLGFQRESEVATSDGSGFQRMAFSTAGR